MVKKIVTHCLAFYVHKRFYKPKKYEQKVAQNKENKENNIEIPTFVGMKKTIQ